MRKKPTYTQITTKVLFATSLVILSLTVLFVWLFGLGSHRTLFENSFISTWILTTLLFQFLFVGLYKGYKLKENIGDIAEKPKFESLGTDFDFASLTASSELEAIFYLIILIPVIIVLILNIAVFFLAAILLFIAILYWVFYRAIKFSFKQSPKCKGNILKSLVYSFIFTLTYSIWFYAIILGVHYFQ
jgi:nucleoside permease NupC